MELNFNPTNEYEQFGNKIAQLIVENFSETFFVGGMVRDKILSLTITDIDITTEATPNQIINLLEQNRIAYKDSAKQFGVIVALDGEKELEIATLRKETYKTNSRFPDVELIKDYKEDSLRRDFTINSLYLRANSNEVLDPQNGLKDLNNNLIRFIGDTEEKIKQDPLRIVRALVLSQRLQFSILQNDLEIMQNNSSLIKTVSENKIQREINKLQSEEQKETVTNFIKNS